MGKFCIGKFPIGESGATSKTGLALGFCGDSFSASPWGGGEFAVNLNLSLIHICRCRRKEMCGIRVPLTHQKKKA